MQVICRFCGKEHNRPAGYRLTRSGQKRIYKCLVCGRKFVQNSAFMKMRNSPEVINQCIDLYMSGVSLRGVIQHVHRTTGLKLSHMSVYRWIRKYSKLVKPYVDSFKVNGQDAHLHADEMMLQMNGEWVWLWNVISQENRFVLATRLSKTRDMNDAKALFDETKSKIDGLPMKITTDGMPAYPRAISHSFYRHAYPRVEHYVAPGITNAHQNNLVERHHNTIRARVKTMRGFHEMGSAADIMNLWNVYFNYLRPNMALNGKRPSESAGLGDRSLIALIEEAYDWNNRCKKSS